ncbi:MAG: ArsC/Spx/MgsR family protein [Burkholderiales bacterium]
MAHVIFYEKPGCQNNARQKALLAEAGHKVNARNLLTEPWKPDALRAFFGPRPVAEWFNRAAPRIKSGEVVPETLGEMETLALMIADPLLIRRPLIQVGNRREAGFDVDILEQWIGLSIPEQREGKSKLDDWESCTRPAHAKGCAVKK